jgi:hypothetical protein
MQHNRLTNRQLGAAAALALAGTLHLAQAQDLSYMTFDTDAQGFPCGGWGAARTYLWDGALDGNTNAASGSLRVDVDFSTEAGATLQTCVGVANLAPFEKFSMDVYLAPGTLPGSSGNYGTLQGRLRPGFAWPGDVFSIGTITNTGWTRFVVPLPVTKTSFSGFNIHWNTTFTTAQSLWLDNLVFIAASAPPQPPTLVLKQQGSGLEIRTTGDPDYSRKNVATVDALAPATSWLNSTGAVTYAMTVSESVEPGSSGYAANLLLCAGTETAINASPDWNLPSGIYLEAIQTTNNTFDVTVRYKTNAPNSHGIRFAGDVTNGFPGLLIERTNTGLTSLVGTWALTLNGSAIQLAGPGGISGSAQLPADALQYFGAGNNLWALFGAQPYTRNNRTIALSRVQISAPADFMGAVDQVFTTATVLDASLRALQEGTGGVVLRPTNTAWRISWGLPDTGLYLWQSPTLKSSDWVNAGITPITQGTFRTVFTTNVNGAGGFFQLRDRGGPPSLLESYETAVPIGENPPYIAIYQDTGAGVTEGTYAMHVMVDNSSTWKWIAQDFNGDATYATWKRHSKIRFDLHRPAQVQAWNLEAVVALNATGAAWTQGQVLNWVTLPANSAASQTLEFDYSAMRAAVPATGSWLQLNLLFRSSQGGDVMIDNVRLVD